MNNLISIRLAIKKKTFSWQKFNKFFFFRFIFFKLFFLSKSRIFSSVNIIEVPFSIFKRMKYKIFFAIWILIQIFVLNSTSLALTFKDNHCLACFKPTPLSYFFIILFWLEFTPIKYNSKALHMSKNIEHRR